MDVITDEVTCGGYGGNTNNLSMSGGVVTLDMTNGTLDPLDDFNGHIAISVLPAAASSPIQHTVSSFNQYAAATTLWGAFTSSTGLPGKL